MTRISEVDRLFDGTLLSVVVPIVFVDYDYHSRWLAMGMRF